MVKRTQTLVERRGRKSAGLVHDNVCFVTLVHGDTAVALADNVQGYDVNPTGSESMATVSLSE